LILLVHTRPISAALFDRSITPKAWKNKRQGQRKSRDAVTSIDLGQSLTALFRLFTTGCPTTIWSRIIEVFTHVTAPWADSQPTRRLCTSVASLMKSATSCDLNQAATNHSHVRGDGISIRRGLSSSWSAWRQRKPMLRSSRTQPPIVA
jgi:hypothetical protein